VSIAVPATKLAGNTKAAKQCKKGWSCGFTCIAKGKECRSQLPGQAKNYAAPKVAAKPVAAKPKVEAKVEPKAAKPKVEVKTATSQIADQKTFEDTALTQSIKLDQDHNHGGLVPIHKLREAMGDSVSRSDFNSRLQKMQEDGAIQLVGDEMPGLTPKIAEDSIKTALGAQRYYLKVLKKPQSAGVDVTAARGSQDTKTAVAKIKDQAGFDKSAKTLIKSLDQDHNHGGLVPIHQLRAAMGDSVSRSDFNSRLQKMQEDGAIQLVGGEMPGLTPKIAEDSIKTALGASRYYIKPNFSETIQGLDFSEIEIEILPKGTHTSSNGFKLPVTDRDLDDLVSSYNPKNFQAPLIISHDTKGLTDQDLGNSEFSFGIPKALKRVGDRVKAVFDRVAPEFEGWVKAGKLLSVSPSFYLPNSPSNPTPGKLSLRHIAALGATPPAIKGMQPLQAAFNFSEGTEGVVDFSFPINHNLKLMSTQTPDSTTDTANFDAGDRLEATLWQNLRDWLISEHDLETADRIIPPYAVGMLIESAAQDDAEDANEPPNYQAMTTDKELEFSERESKLAEREAALLSKELISFCECELKGKLTPAIAPQAELISFMSFLNTQTEVNRRWSGSKAS
jgi:hypothetical protein